MRHSRSGLVLAALPALLIAAAPPAEAAGGTLEGKVLVLGGTLEPGWMVRLTRVPDGEPFFLPLIDETFETPELPEGLYSAVVVQDRNRKEIGVPTRVVIAPGVNTVDLLVDLRLAGPAGRRWWQRPRVWAYAGGAAAGAFLLSEALDDDDDEDRKERKASPSAP